MKKWKKYIKHVLNKVDSDSQYFGVCTKKSLSDLGIIGDEIGLPARSIFCQDHVKRLRSVCLVTDNTSSKAENSFISAISRRHCFITASP